MTDNNTKPRGRSLTIDVLNILSCIAVIALHHNGLVHTYDTSRAWKESLVVECVCYWCVPVFLMITGANLMGYRDKYSTKVYAKKRILRTVIPWLCWSVIFLFWKLATGQITLEEDHIVKQCLGLIMNNKVMTVYWFFSTLFACYLVIPVFSLLRDQHAVLWYIVVLNFVFASFLPIINKWIDFSWGLTVPVVGSCLIFVLLGYLLKDIKYSRKQRFAIYAIGFGCMIFRYIYTYHFSILRGSTDTSIKGYQYFHSVLYAVAVWIMGWNLKWNRIIPAWLQRRIPEISTCSLGIYLIHRFVMYYEQMILGMDKHDLLWRTACIILTYAVSLFLVWIMKKTPLVRRIVP